MAEEEALEAGEESPGIAVSVTYEIPTILMEGIPQVNIQKSHNFIVKT
jgi:hypothetical protein